MKTMMDLLYRWIVIAALLAGAAVAFAQESPSEVQAPFGLKWGASQSEFSDLTDCESKQSITFCKVNSVPKPLSDAESHRLAFDDKEGLVKIGYFGNQITGDPFGTEGVKRFNELKSALSSKYPKAEKQSFISMHKNLYRDSDEFYECLRYSGCGLYAWGVSPGKGTIGLQIKGLSRGRGYIGLTYESPKWVEVIKKAKSSNQADDKDAL